MHSHRPKPRRFNKEDLIRDTRFVVMGDQAVQIHHHRASVYFASVNEYHDLLEARCAHCVALRRITQCVALAIGIIRDSAAALG